MDVWMPREQWFRAIFQIRFPKWDVRLLLPVCITSCCQFFKWEMLKFVEICPHIHLLLPLGCDRLLRPRKISLSLHRARRRRQFYCSVARIPMRFNSRPQLPARKRSLPERLYFRFLVYIHCSWDGIQLDFSKTGQMFEFRARGA